MIWFACKKCNRRHNRPDTQAGAMVFCECGHATRVPWTSDLIAEAVPAPEPAPPPLPPRPRPRPAEKPILDAQPVPAAVLLPGRKPGRLLGKVNPNFCFQHDDAAATASCAACRLPLCAACVVTIQGQTLCGPCKNFRLASPGQPRRTLPLAVIALVSALASGPVALILSLAAAGVVFGEGLLGVGVAMAVLGSTLPTTALVLAGLALHRLESRPQASGHGLAASAACVALVGMVWCATVIVVLCGKRLLD